MALVSRQWPATITSGGLIHLTLVHDGAATVMKKTVAPRLPSKRAAPMHGFERHPKDYKSVKKNSR